MYDFIIAGGGIVGCVCGKRLSEMGYKCIILEKASKPFEKICGGWIPFKALYLLSTLGWNTDLLVTDGAVVTNGVIVTKNNKEHTYLYKKGEYGIGLKRELFHRFLVSGASNAGCKVRYSQNVKDVNFTNDIYTVGDYSAHRLIMAIGTGVTDGVCGNNQYEGQTFGISELICADTDLKEDTVYFWYPDSNGKGYFWAIPIQKGTWNIGWWDETAVNLKRSFFYYRNIYAMRYFSNIRTIRTPKGAPCGSSNHIDFLPYPAYAAGDFAGCNDPNSGEGIYFAIRSAADLTEKFLPNIDKIEDV